MVVSAKLISCKQWLVAAMLLCVAALPVQAFQLQAMNAERVNLANYVGDGRWTLVMFWSTDCIPCEEQKPMIEAFHRDHHDKDATVVGIALDGLENLPGIQHLVDHHQPSYPNLVVFTDVFHRQYKELTGKDFRATPTYLLYNPAGEVAGVRAGRIDRAMIESVVAGQ